MKRLNRMLAGLAAAAVLSAAALPVAAAGETAQFTATPDQTEIATGDTVTLSVWCSQADLDPAAAILTFEIGENYVFTEARTGSGISLGELSYSYQNGQLVLLYLDNAGGGSPLAPGEEMAVVTLQAASAAEGEPMTCTETDISAVGTDGNAVSLQGNTEIGTVAVTGETVELMTPAPVVVEDGVEQDAQSLLTSPAPGSAASSSSSSPTAQPAPDAGSQSSQTEAAPAPTPFYTTMPSGERVEILPGESAEPVDRTQEVLGGQPASTPVPEQESSARPVMPLVLAGVAVVVVAAVGITMYILAVRRKSGRK